MLRNALEHVATCVCPARLVLPKGSSAGPRRRHHATDGRPRSAALFIRRAREVGGVQLWACHTQGELAPALRVQVKQASIRKLALGYYSSREDLAQEDILQLSWSCVSW